MMIPYETLLDAARQHFDRVYRDPTFTNAARQKAGGLRTATERELQAFNDGHPTRGLFLLNCDCGGLGAGPAWDENNPAKLRAA
jgi:hypothetical protein